MSINKSKRQLSRTMLPPSQANIVRSPSRAWAITMMLVLFMMINWADKALLGLAAVPIMEELRIDAGMYGLISSSFFLFFSLSGLVVGFISNRIPSKWLLLALTLGWSLSQLPVLLAGSVFTLLLTRVMLGITEGPAAPQSTHAVFKWFIDSRRAVPSALLLAGIGAGTFFAAPILTWIIEGFGWRAAFAFMALVGVAWAAAWLFIGKEGPYAAETHSKAIRDGSPGNPSYRMMLRTGTFLGSAVSGFGSYWAVALGSAFIPTYLITQKGYTPGAAAGAISFYSLVSVVALLTVVPLTDVLLNRGATARIVRGLPQGVIVLLAGGAALALPFAGSTALQVILIGIAFGACQLAWPLSYLTASSISPAHSRGGILGTLVAFHTLPGLFAPAVSGWLIDSAATTSDGYIHTFIVAGVIMIACGLFALVTVQPDTDSRRLGVNQFTVNA